VPTLTAHAPSHRFLTWHQRPDGRVEHRFEGAVALLALLIVPALIITETKTTRDLQDAATAAMWVTWIALALDLAFVLLVARRRLAALKAHWLEAVVVLAAVPLPPLLLLRQLRFARLLRVGQLAVVGMRVVSSERRRAAHARLRNIGLLTGLLLITASLSVTQVDARDFPNIWRALWWSVVTATTVGYGDITPHTVPGRLIAVVLMLVGIGFLSMLTATIAASFIAKDADHEEEVVPYHREILDALGQIEARLARVEQSLARDDD
jgi:voltage-gated potassium channel